MTRWLIVGLAVPLLSCQAFQEKEPDSGLVGYDPNAPATEQAACEARGGAYSKAGLSGGLVCIETTRDSEKSCSASSQCESMCLARSGTCAPVKPLFGCHDIFTDNGGKATVCID